MGDFRIGPLGAVDSFSGQTKDGSKKRLRRVEPEEEPTDQVTLSSAVEAEDEPTDEGAA